MIDKDMYIAILCSFTSYSVFQNLKKNFEQFISLGPQKFSSVLGMSQTQIFRITK